MKSGRGTYLTLGIVGTVAALVALASENGPIVGALAIGTFVALAAAVFATSRLRELQAAIPQITASVKATPNARTATTRARRISSYAPDETVTDIAVIVNEKDRSGRWTRRIAQNVSMDDPFVQPIVKFTAPPDHTQRVAIVKFEIIDKAGKTQFSRQVEHYVRDGENLVACDQQLPFRGNTKLGRAGTWDLQVSINGQLAAIHSFTVTPSQYDHTTPTVKTASDGEIDSSRLRVPDEEEDNMPMTLEDLLREQRGESTSSRN